MSLLARRHIIAPDIFGTIEYVGSAQFPSDNGSNTATPVTLTPPSGMKNGDLVFVMVSARSDDNAFSVDNAGGQTWNALTLFSDSGGDGFRTRVFWCQFNGTWSANPAWAYTGTARTRSAAMLVFRSTSPKFAAWNYEGQTTSSTDSVNPITNFGRTTTHNMSLTIAAWQAVTATLFTGFAGAAGWTNISTNFRNVGGLDNSTSYSYIIQKFAGATGNVEKLINLPSSFGNQFVTSFYPTFNP